MLRQLSIRFYNNLNQKLVICNELKKKRLNQIRIIPLKYKGKSALYFSLPEVSQILNLASQFSFSFIVFEEKAAPIVNS